MPRSPIIGAQIAVLVSALFVFAAEPAAAQINRCTTADGGTVYTDRKCSDLGAVERLPRDGSGGQARGYRGGCARNLHDLIHEMTVAIDSRDVNRLAGVYHWPGMSHRAGYGTMDRLDRIVQQPLVDIVALRPATPVVVVERAGISARVTADSSVRVAGDRRPVALRVEQTAGDSAAPVRTIFGLRRHMDCWWVSL
ncbi:DUF4124 domain-containing protein [Luteimonas sp. RD2P54]|uniref:DUF4124 domain-containing protein n=1 Tax=Luteimonas endophytica TaxID=3042023 RepID=A0ABT6J825_9GAMM|nr:DUF4124 domain-containing protein [Luteimonas endophytica]MDH5822970.1 DUF4124 domain-containing protein [Luteimonas endophytica]